MIKWIIFLIFALPCSSLSALADSNLTLQKNKLSDGSTLTLYTDSNGVQTSQVSMANGMIVTTTKEPNGLTTITTQQLDGSIDVSAKRPS